MEQYGATSHLATILRFIAVAVVLIILIVLTVFGIRQVTSNNQVKTASTATKNDISKQKTAQKDTAKEEPAKKQDKASESTPQPTTPARPQPAASQPAPAPVVVAAPVPASVPSTGPREVAVTIAGIIALTYGIYMFFHSRHTVNKRKIAAQYSLFD